MLVLQFASLEEDNEQRIYVPKSQRSKLWTLLLPIRTWTNDMAKTIESSINNWTSSARARSRIARMHHSTGRIDSSRRKGSLGVRMMAFAASVAMQANGMQSNYLEMMVTFDADSVPVGVDNRCMGCVSN
jgi:hypothetical protein